MPTEKHFLIGDSAVDNMEDINDPSFMMSETRVYHKIHELEAEIERLNIQNEQLLFAYDQQREELERLRKQKNDWIRSAQQYVRVAQAEIASQPKPTPPRPRTGKELSTRIDD